MDHQNNQSEVCSQQQKVTPVRQKDPLDTDYITVLKKYLVLKYVQYMILPSTNLVVMSMGASATLYVSVLLLSETVSKKCTSVFISHLAAADVLLVPATFFKICHQVIDVKLASANFISGLIHNLLSANVYVSSTVLSCIILEAFLITQFPRQSRHLRTVRHARLTCMFVWIVVVTECIMLQIENVTSYNKAAFSLEEAPLSWTFEYFALIAPVVRIVFDSLIICFKFTNVLFYYKVYSTKSHSRHLSSR